MRAIWHWKGSVISQKTIEGLAVHLNRVAPALTDVFVKVGDGGVWQGRFDNPGDMAVNGPSDLQRWVYIMKRYNLGTHAWVVLKGIDIDGEAQNIIDACKTDGIKSMILDVEPFDGYWKAGPGPIVPLMKKVRDAIGYKFHIGLSIDPRRQHYNSVFPDRWRPYVDSVHPMCYWVTFGWTPEQTIDHAYQVWGTYGLPIYPILQGASSAPDVIRAIEKAKEYGANGFSWWRKGVPIDWEGVNYGHKKTEEVIDYDINSSSLPANAFFSGSYTGKNELATSDDAFYATTSKPSTSWAMWRVPASLPQGIYNLSANIPCDASALCTYSVNGTLVTIDQGSNRGQLVSLGNHPLSGGEAIFVTNWRQDQNESIIGFGNMQLRRVMTSASGGIANGVFVADGFDYPIGDGNALDGWRDASPFGKLYFVGTPQEAYHTGADWNWGRLPNDDLGMPVFSPASGVVVFQDDLPVWGNVTVIKHDPLRNGEVYYTRYGHMQNVRINVGDRVGRGKFIGEIGNVGGRFAAHLHFDVVKTAVLENNPGHWPKLNKQELLKHYVDPTEFIKNNRP